MEIKNMITACLMCCGLAAAFTSCSKDEDSYYTVSEDDAPRILNTDFPTGGFSINRDQNLKFDILVTPADYTTVKWLVDGDEVFVGTHIDKPFEAGDYTLKIVAVTNKGKETSRTMALTVKPLTTDPQSASDALAERLVKAGAAVTLHGANLDNVQQVKINGQSVAAVFNSADGSISYTVPADLTDGSYRISLIDNNNQSYGAGQLTVVTKPTVCRVAVDGTQDGGSVTLEGYYLDKVTSIVVAGQEMPITAKSDQQLTFTAPAMAVADYELKGTTDGGEPLQFFKDYVLYQVGQYHVSLETTLLEGNFIIDWDSSICHLDPDKFDNVPVGSKILIYYEVPTAEYHNLRIVTNWWTDVPGGKQIDVTDDTPNPFELKYTDEFKSMVYEQGGMSCVGFGYTVKRITFK